MKRIIACIIIALLLCPMLLLFSSCERQERDVLTVYNCEDYIDESTLADFEAWYLETTGKKVTVNYITYDTNETMLAKLVNKDASVDVVVGSEYAIQKLYRSGFLLPIAKTEGMDTVNPDIYERVNSVFGADFIPYFVPYMYGTLGILYNAGLLEEEGIDIEEEGWSILWNKVGNDKLSGKILLKDSIRDTFAAGVMYLKEQGELPINCDGMTSEELINCTDKDLVDAVCEALVAQKPHLKNYEVDFGKDDMCKESAYLDLAWSGDAMYAIEEGEAVYGVELAYYVPEEVGTNVWFDGWFIPNCCKHVDAANMFIEFMCRPEVSAANMIEVGYTSAVDRSHLIDNEDVIDLLLDAEYATFDADEDVDEEALASAKQLVIDYIAQCEAASIAPYADYLDEIDPFETDAYASALYSSLSDYFTWDVRYPDVSNPLYGVMKDYGDATTEMTTMWMTVKAATPEGASPMWEISLICMGAVVLGAGLAVGIVLLVVNCKRNRSVA